MPVFLREALTQSLNLSRVYDNTFNVHNPYIWIIRTCYNLNLLVFLSLNQVECKVDGNRQVVDCRRELREVAQNIRSSGQRIVTVSLIRTPVEILPDIVERIIRLSD